MPNIKLMEHALPTAPLKIAALESCMDLGKKVNDYFTENGVGVFNGDIGYIEDINLSDNEVTVMFEDGRKAIYN